MDQPLLITAFEPFANRETNVSQRLCESLSRLPPDRVEVALLPVDFKALRRRVPALLRRFEPKRWLMVGEGQSAEALRCERIALNLLEGTQADNKGKLPSGSRIRRNAPDAYFTTLDPRWLVQQLRDADVPAELSHHAGTFACNLSLFLALHHVDRNHLPTEVGFIHIPRDYQRVARTLPQLRESLSELVSELVRAPEGALRPRH